MKNLHIFIAAIFLYSCQPSPHEKAKALIRTYLNRNLAFPQYYQSVSFSALDSVFTTYEETKEHQLIAEKLDTLRVIFHYFSNTAKKRPSRDLYLKETASLKYLDSIKQAAYKSRFGGWMLVHEFRGKQQDSIIQVSCKFSFDKNVERITKIEWIK